LTIDFCSETQDEDVVSVIATEPLTHNEAWQAFRTGELLVFRHGALEHQLLETEAG